MAAAVGGLRKTITEGLQKDSGVLVSHFEETATGSATPLRSSAPAWPACSPKPDRSSTSSPTA